MLFGKNALLLYFVLIFTCCAACFGNDSSIQQQNGQIRILFNDVNVLRRSPDSAPVVGNGGEDYAVRIGCLGLDDCTSKIPNIYKVLSSRKQIEKPCSNPIYAVIEMQFAGQKYGVQKADEKYQIDSSGYCLQFDGKYFKLNKSLFEILNKNPIPNW